MFQLKGGGWEITAHEDAIVVKAYTVCIREKYFIGGLMGFCDAKKNLMHTFQTCHKKRAFIVCD